MDDFVVRETQLRLQQWWDFLQTRTLHRRIEAVRQRLRADRS